MAIPVMNSVGDFGLLSDCHSAALLSREGTIVWYCPARFDAPSVFARMLDPHGGYWALHPTEAAQTTREYVEDTLVLRTTFQATQGSVIVTDGLALEPGARGHQIGEHSPHQLVRRVEGLTGSVDMVVEFAPRMNYALSQPNLVASEHGVIAHDHFVELHLATHIPLAFHDTTASAHFTVHPGDVVDFALQYRELGPSSIAMVPLGRVDVGAVLRNASEGWQSWVAEHTGYQGPYTQHVRRSALVLQALTYQPTGAVVAAATTSLPEDPGGSANWDYRFAWLRDLSFTAKALYIAACPTETQRLFGWVQRAIGSVSALAEPGRSVQIMFGVNGERTLTEYALQHLRGFQESRPVRVGNEAFRQKQLDVLGEVLDAVLLFQRHLSQDESATGVFDDALAQLIAALADQAAQRWQEPDAGMWEARDQERHYLSAKVMCWVALDRAIRLAGRLGVQAAHVPAWTTARDAVRQAVLEQGWSEKTGAYTGAFGSDNLDASVLLMPLVGFLPATDTRMWTTITTIERELAADGLVHRWVGDKYGFFLCTYWLVECLALAGQVQRATILFEQTTAYANDLGLLAEMGDATTHQLMGNIPQTFSHVGLINAAWALGQAQQRQQEHLSKEAGSTGAVHDVSSIPARETATQQEIRSEDMTQRLQDKVALITGSDSGIGQATAIEFAKEGAHVVITYLQDQQGAEQTSREVEAQGRRALVIQVDTSDEQQVATMFDRALATFGTVDILMNNGGVDASGTHVADLATEVWDRAIRTNLYGYFFCCRRFINIRKQAGGGGKIINISSVHEEIPRAGAADYDCSKGAIRNLTRTLALELAPLKMNVNNIGPGMVLTPFNQDAIDDPKVREQQVQSIPWKRAAQPQEIGRLAVFLASSDADYVTGSSYYMDGGLMQNQGQGA